ncbi:hypothetical protein KR222_000587 [Zaprionus bogoriensis]|nr:hypothetical protein KR222_000587 [Zaprionus bogoriensis]
MFGTLNDDCWLKVLEYVDNVRDQLTLAHTSKRLQENVHYHWRHLKEAQLNSELLEYFEQHPDEMHDFLRCASASLEQLELKRGCRKLLRSWKAYRFPHVRSLEFHSWLGDVAAADEDTLLQTQLFPQLTKLTLQSSISGRHLCRWSHLQELHLICCESLNPFKLRKIFRSLPLRKVTLLYYGYNTNLSTHILPISMCVTLEELVIDDHHLLGDFLPNLLCLPRFRRLAFYTRDYADTLVLAVSNLTPRKLQSLLFKDVFWSSCRLTDFTCRFPNLRRLTLHQDDIETNMLYKLCTALPHLEELQLLDMRGLPTPTQLWDMVAACEALNCLDLSDNALDEQFVELSIPQMHKALDKRTASSPFTLRLHNTRLRCNAREALAQLTHPNLRLSFKPVNIDLWSDRFIEMEFNLTAELC